jgi:hypothetical protein
MPVAQPPLTFSMKEFDDGDLFSTEDFFSINGPIVTFNLTLVDSASILELNPNAASVMLNLKDGTTKPQRFTITPHGVVEYNAANTNDRY